MGGRNGAFAWSGGVFALAVAATGSAQTPSYTFTTIDFPNAISTAARGINDGGQIVGYFSDSSGTHAFLLSDGIFISIDYPSASSTQGRGINSAGEIVGYFTDSVGTHGFFRDTGGNFSPAICSGGNKVRHLRSRHQRRERSDRRRFLRRYWAATRLPRQRRELHHDRCSGGNAQHRSDRDQQPFTDCWLLRYERRLPRYRWKLRDDRCP